MPDRRKSRHRTAPTGLAARLLAQVRLDAATIVFALAALAYLCAAMASGLDREFEKRPSGLYVLGWPLPEYLSLARTRNALVDKDYDRALAAARAAIRTSPLDMHSVGALGFAMQAVGKEAEAEPAYKVAATLGWRDPATQLYWFDKALNLGDIDTAMRHLDALLRVSPQFPLRDTLIDRVAQYEQGRDALAARLRRAPESRSLFVTDMDDPSVERLDARADVVRRAGRGLWTCDELAVLVSRLRTFGLLEDATTVWRPNCPSRSPLIYDPEFEHLDHDPQLGGFYWVLRRDGDTRITQVDLQGGKQMLSAVVSGASTGEIVIQPTVFTPGVYRIMWSMPDTAPADSKAFLVSLDCDQQLSEAAHGTPVPGTRDRFQAELDVTDECPAQYLTFWVEPHHPVNLAHIAVTKIADKPRPKPELVIF